MSPSQSQRELSLRVPINYVNHPGVVLTAACFGNDSYEETAAAKCISNLLVSGFRRLEADVFWDASRLTWSLCPVELGGGDDDGGGANATLTASTSVPAAPISVDSNMAGRDMHHLRRQDEETLSQTSAASTTVVMSTSMMPIATLTANPTNTSAPGTSPPANSDAAGGTLFKAGPYSCTYKTDWQLLVSIVSAHLVRLLLDVTCRCSVSLDGMLTSGTGKYGY